MAETNNQTTTQDLFKDRVIPIMESVQRDLQHKQLEEYARHASGWGAAIAAAAGPDGGLSATAQFNDSIYYIGKWNSKTAEDYIDMVKAELKKNSIEVDAVLEKKMVDYLIKKQMPKSTTDFILRKAAEGSLFFIPQRLRTSPLQDHINQEGEYRYNPSLAERLSGATLGVTANAVSTGGFGGFWGQAVVDGVIAGADYAAPGKEEAYLLQQKQLAEKEVMEAKAKHVTIPDWMNKQMGFESAKKATDQQLASALTWATEQA